jgi:hypothetical protein
MIGWIELTLLGSILSLFLSSFIHIPFTSLPSPQSLCWEMYLVGTQLKGRESQAHGTKLALSVMQRKSTQFLTCPEMSMDHQWYCQSQWSGINSGH